MTILREFTAKPRHLHVVFTFWVYIYTNPPPPVPSFLLTLNQSPKDIAGSDITNCLTHTCQSCMTGYADIGGYRGYHVLCMILSWHQVVPRHTSFNDYLVSYGCYSNTTMCHSLYSVSKIVSKILSHSIGKLCQYQLRMADCQCYHGNPFLLHELRWGHLGTRSWNKPFLSISNDGQGSEPVCPTTSPEMSDSRCLGRADTAADRLLPRTSLASQDTRQQWIVLWHTPNQQWTDTEMAEDA